MLHETPTTANLRFVEQLVFELEPAGLPCNVFMRTRGPNESTRAFFHRTVFACDDLQ